MKVDPFRTESGAAPEEEPFVVAPPSVSLPKGGGAIRGIGEKFAANPVTGTASVSIPIAVSPGRSGFQPDLTLAYDSGSGNGPFGLGWQLSISSIRRKTEKGLPRYRDGEDSDVFILSGMEDLVPALVEEGGAWRDDAREQDGYLVRRYSPRVEESFWRIERWTDPVAGTVFWKTVSRDNVTRIYGKSADARVADPSDGRRVFEWLLEEVWDERGNGIHYEYKAEDRAEVDQTRPYERARSVPGHGCTYRYPKRVRYANRVPFSREQWLFEVVFDYGEHDEEAPGVDEIRSWPVRADVFSSFRAGFDVRCHRLCRRALMFHRFPELGEDPVLVRSTDFTYEESPVAMYLTGVTWHGYIRDGDGYTRESLPPVEFEYSRAVIDEEVRSVDGLDDIPGGFAPSRYQWVDLDGEGAVGLLAEQGGGWLYKRNDVDHDEDPPRARFAPAAQVASRPTAARAAAGAQLLDLAGDGKLDLVLLGEGVAGYQERGADGRWGRFQPFQSVPALDWQDPDLRLVDLDGDGHADVLITEDEVLRWYSSLAKKGFAAAVIVRKEKDEERGPTAVFSSEGESVFLADMSGDGLADIVRIRNGSVCYWPNLGHGRFGAKIVMAGSPWFDAPDQFDARRIRLADIDGSGTTDILYLARDAVRIWFNQSGNGFAEVRELSRIPGTDSLTDVRVADLLGDGTACLVWSSPLPGRAREPLRYVHLMGEGKPHLLTEIRNNLGRETRLEYAPSTKFCLADRKAGRPWVTRLPFPVHVLERVVRWDGVTGTKFSTRYRWHDGYFDGEDREFRGFGYVEHWDSEDYDAFNAEGDGDGASVANGDQEHFVPPTYTGTWYHTGAWSQADTISRHYVDEYFAGDENAGDLPDTVLPEGLTAQEEREACRALKGRMLREEVYAEDDSEAAADPYLVIERNYHLRRLQPSTDRHHAVFIAVPAETLRYHYDRFRGEAGRLLPRVTHELTLDFDDFANVTRSARIAYAHRDPEEPEQGVTRITVTETSFINQTDQEGCHVGLPYEARSYEITGPRGAAITDAELLTPAGLRAAFLAAEEIPYETEPDSAGDTPQRRLIAHSRTLFWNDDLTGPWPFGPMLGRRALVYESYRLALTAGLVAGVHRERLSAEESDAIRQEAGYELFSDDGDGAWWVRSGRHEYAPADAESPGEYAAAHFCQPISFMDPFANRYRSEHDEYDLLPTRVIDPADNAAAVLNDYRVLQPTQLEDANGNRTAVGFDALGMVVWIAVMGKNGEGEGDTGDDPTTSFEYQLHNWAWHGEPNYAHVRTKERHGRENSRYLETYTYADGFGNNALTKVRGEPGTLADGTWVDDRWIGTGRRILNNKGDVVRQYEPYFAAHARYEGEPEAREQGATPVFHYDSLGRNIRTDLPNGAFRRVEIQPWRQEIWDENDTVLDSEWYVTRKNGTPGSDEQRTALLAAEHADTPTTLYLDALGRPFLTERRLAAGEHVSTRVRLDIQGNARVLTDARGVATLEQTFDLLGRTLHTRSVDAGETWVLPDATGQPVRTWRSGGSALRHGYDGLRRRTHLWVDEGDGERLAELKVYGDALEDADPAANLRGRLALQFDGAGLRTDGAYDFKGNLIRTSRRLLSDREAPVDWSALEELGRQEALLADTQTALDSEEFRTETGFDALNRKVSLTAPDGSVLSFAYNERGLLGTIRVRIRGASEETAFVTGVTYNARGERESIAYGNGVRTSYTYDAKTFRLTGVHTTRPGDTEGQDTLQSLHYTYDPVGNITRMRDEAQDTLFFANARVEPGASYVYDALYRLTEASGREHVSLGQPAATDPLRGGLPHPNDGTAVRAYTETYLYDPVGNLLEVAHFEGAALNSAGHLDHGPTLWRRRYETASDSNRLLGTSLSGDADGVFSARYTYDARGSMVAMPHLPGIEPDFRDQMHRVDLGNGDDAVYDYDADGRRIRKTVRRGAGVEERIYVDGFEIYRNWVAGRLELERQTLHVVDELRRVAMIETKTVDGGSAVEGPASRLRSQLDNHLGSALLELDGEAKLISYEEYHPFGGTGWHAESASIEVSAKRYRYSGKEKDEETGLYYHGARYYACWLGRWTSPDPVDLADGMNRYAFVHNNPVRLRDPSGRQATMSQQEQQELHRLMEETGVDPVGFIPLVGPARDALHNYHMWIVSAGEGASALMEGDVAGYFEATLRASGYAELGNINAGFALLDYASLGGASLARGAVGGLVRAEARNMPRAMASQAASRELRAGQSGGYREMVEQGVPGDKLTPDHQLSNAAQQRRYEQRLQEEGLPPPTPEERRFVRDEANTFVVEESAHREASPTYGGRNTRARQQLDAADPAAALSRDQDAYVQYTIDTMLAEGKSEGEILEAVDELMLDQAAFEGIQYEYDVVEELIRGRKAAE
ncbi:MAG: VCBS repeat-containing protein [Gemmatimonadetes bacterium]|nr:VCBS repeat-containing protein [Gemmatimonadota bacterium]